VAVPWYTLVGVVAQPLTLSALVAVVARAEMVESAMEEMGRVDLQTEVAVEVVAVTEEALQALEELAVQVL
jgi:hypothetical protein